MTKAIKDNSHLIITYAVGVRGLLSFRRSTWEVGTGGTATEKSRWELSCPTGSHHSSGTFHLGTGCQCLCSLRPIHTRRRHNPLPTLQAPQSRLDTALADKLGGHAMHTQSIRAPSSPSDIQGTHSTSAFPWSKMFGSEHQLRMPLSVFATSAHYWLAFNLASSCRSQLWVRQLNQFSDHLTGHLSSLYFMSLSQRMLWATVSKALLKLRSTLSTTLSLFTKLFIIGHPSSLVAPHFPSHPLLTNLQKHFSTCISLTRLSSRQASALLIPTTCAQIMFLYSSQVTWLHFHL